MDDILAPRHYVPVDDTGIEPVTPTMSMWCSTAEPIVLVTTVLQLLLLYLNIHQSVQVEVGTGFEPVWQDLQS